MNPTRPQPSLELLRSAAALAVVGVHVAAGVLVAQPLGSDSVWWVANLFDALCRWCVPVFVMLSGALLLSGPAAEAAPDFYRRRARRLWQPMLAWSLFYLAFSALTEPAWRWQQGLASVLRGVPYYHLWYLYMLPGLYLATPWLRRLIARCRPGQLNALILLCCALAFAQSLFGPRNPSFLTTWLPFVGNFLLGYVLFQRRIHVVASKLTAVFLLAALGLAVGVGCLRPMLGAQAMGLMYIYANPLVLLMGVCVFLLGLQLHTRGINWLAGLCLRLAPLSFGIYLIHPLWLWLLARLGIDGFWWHPVLGIPLTALLGFSLSALATAGLLRVPGLKRCVQ